MYFRGFLKSIACIILSSVSIMAQTSISQNRSLLLKDEQDFRDSIHSITNEDSVLDLYVEYAVQQRRMNPKKILELAEEIRAKQEIGQLKRNAYSNNLKGIYWNSPNPDSALKYQKLAEQQYDDLGQKRRVVGLILNQAKTNMRLQEYLESERLYFKALTYIDENKISDFKPKIVINEMVSLYIRLGATEIALARLTELLENTSGNINEECDIRLKISNVKKSNQQIDEAVNQLLACATNDVTNKQLLITVYRSLSDLERIRGNQKNRIRWIEKATQYNSPNPILNVPTHLFLAKAYFDNGDFDKTDSLLADFENLNMNYVQVEIHVSLAMLKIQNSFRLGDYKSAIQYANEGIVLTEKMSVSLIAIDLQRLKAEALEKIGDFENAYQILKELENKEELFEKLGRIREEEQSRVRLQFRATSDQLEDVTTKLDITRIRAFFIISIILILSSFLVYRYRIISALRVEKTRNNIANDLHDEVSATLTGISYFAEAIQRDKDDERKQYFMNLITESATDAKEKITDIVWAVTPENDDWEKFLSKCRRYASDLLESKEIKYELKITETISGKLNMDVRQHIWMIYKEMLTNVARHSKAEQVDIIIDSDHKIFKLIVQDNGRGFNSDHQKHGNGLKNIKHRANKIHAQLTLDSEEGFGTRWKLELNV